MSTDFFGKKGMIFTVIAVLLVSVMISSTFFLTKSSYIKKSFVANSRVSSMNDFLLSVEADMDRSIMISGYRTIISLQKDIASNGEFLDDFDSSFFEVFVNGTLNGSAQDLMVNASLNDWISRINEESVKVNIIFDFTPNSLVVYHDTPWSVVIELNGTMNVSDSSGLASWNYNKSFKRNIDIVSFEDPVYTIKSYNKVTNLIIKANYSDFVDLSNNDTSVLLYHTNNMRYIASTDAPSFLMRFEGNLSPSNFGIESLVDLQSFSNQNIETYDKSVIDYEYFNDAYNRSDKCDFPDMPSWFRIDSQRLGTYNLSSLGSACP